VAEKVNLKENRYWIPNNFFRFVLRISTKKSFFKLCNCYAFSLPTVCFIHPLLTSHSHIGGFWQKVNFLS